MLESQEIGITLEPLTVEHSCGNKKKRSKKDAILPLFFKEHLIKERLKF